jgi:hypothetical protein
MPQTNGVPAVQAAAGVQQRNPQWQAPVIPLDADTTRPNEHSMDGVDRGPGRTAAQAGIPTHDDGSPEAVSSMLRGIYAATGNPAILGLIGDVERTRDAGLANIDRVHGHWQDPVDPRPPRGMQFDPNARLDPSQVLGLGQQGIHDHIMGMPADQAAGITAGLATGAAGDPRMNGESGMPEDTSDPAGLNANGQTPAEVAAEAAGGIDTSTVDTPQPKLRKGAN